MKPISKSDLRKKTNRELASLKEAFHRELGNIEQDRRQAQAASSDIRTVQGQRRIMRPNL